MKTQQVNVEQATRKAWLIGLGLCESGVQTLTRKFDQMYTDGNKLFNDCIERGTAVETGIQSKLKETITLPEGASEVLNRVESAFAYSSDNKLEVLSQKVDKLTALVATLEKAQAPEKAKTKAVSAKRTTAKSPSNKSAGIKTSGAKSQVSMEKTAETKNPSAQIESEPLKSGKAPSSAVDKGEATDKVSKSPTNKTASKSGVNQSQTSVISSQQKK